MDIILTNRLKNNNLFPNSLDTDQIWEYTSSPESWEDLCGEAGIALVRDGKVVEKEVLLRN